MRTPFHALPLALALAVVSPVLSTGCSGDATREEVGNVSETRGHFEIFVGADDQYYFHLVAGNGEIVLQSEGYTRKSGAEVGIESVKVNGVLVARYSVLEASNGEHYFVLRAANHEIIGLSELYASKQNADRGVETVREIVAGLSAKGASDEDVRAAIELGAKGASYTSESDYDYSYVHADLGGSDLPITVDLVREAMASYVDGDPDADKPLADLYSMEATWADWLTTADSCADESDEWYRELCIEQAELDAALAANLSDLKVFYFGSYGAEGAVDGVAVSIIIVGRTPDGNLAGVRTIAIWT